MKIEEGFVWAQEGTQGMICQIRQLLDELGMLYF
jgi:hypothetical protein